MHWMNIDIEWPMNSIINWKAGKRKMIKRVMMMMMMMMMICNSFYQNQSKFVKVNFCTIAEKCDYLWVVMMICNSSAYQNQSKFILQMKNVIIYEVFTLLGMFHMDSHHFIIIYKIHSQSPWSKSLFYHILYTTIADKQRWLKISNFTKFFENSLNRRGLMRRIQWYQIH